MSCPHSIIDEDNGEYYCVKCGDVVSKPESWDE